MKSGSVTVPVPLPIAVKFSISTDPDPEIPAVPGVHALRLFGRLESETDRSWMIFFAGVVTLLPIAIGLGVNAPHGENPNASGLWGAFVAFYWQAWFGSVGAWVVVVKGGAGAAVVGLAFGALGGGGGGGAGAGAVVAGPGCSFCGDWLAWPPTRTTVATMTMNAVTMAAPIIVRPPSVLNHGVVPGLGSVSVISC